MALLLVPLLFAVLYFAPDWVLPMAVSVVSVLSVQELLGVSRFVRKKRILAYAVIFTALVPLYDFWKLPGRLATLGLLLYLAVLFAEGMLDQENVTFEVIGGTYTVSLLFPLFLSSITRIVGMPSGKYIVLFAFIIPFITDIFAMLVGLAFGRHKLAPRISPKKSVEGAVGGLIAAILFSALYGLILRTAFDYSVSYPKIALMAAVGSFAGQFGDLSLSFVKREFHVKDFGNILPGHGGILDRFDSLIFSAPIVEAALITLTVAWI